MRKHLRIFLFLLFFASPALAQQTLVTGTITDPNGLPWAGGSIQASLTLPVGASGATLNGVQIGGTTQRTALDNTGSFTMQLPDNAIVQPPGTQWTFNVAISPGVLPPIGFGPVSFSVTLTITGASQNVSAALSAASPALSHSLGGNPAFSAITSGTNTAAAMLVGTGASLAPTGSGTIQATNITNGVGAPVNPCTNGALYTDNATGNTYSCDSLVWTIIGSVSSFNPNLINPSLLGVVADGKIFYSVASTLGVTNGSSTVTCNNCNFTNADVGKNIEATTGCCGGPAMFSGVLSLASTPITSVTNATTVSVAPATAVATCTPGCTLGYGHNDDTGWTAVDNAINAGPNCSTIVFPFGYSFTKEPHFGSFSGTHLCDTSAAAHDYNYRFLGGGPYTSVLVIQSDFDWPACLFGVSNKGCYFTYTQEVVDNLGITGLGYGNTGNHAKDLVYPGQGSQFSDDSFFGFAGSDTSAVGMSFQSGTRGKFLNFDGFGTIGAISTTVGTPAINYCFWCFFGDNLTTNFKVVDNPFVDFGSEYGVTTGTGSLLIVGSYYEGHSSSLFAGGANHPTGTGGCGIYVQGGNAHLYGGSWDNSVSTNGNGACVQNGVSNFYAQGVTFKGSGTGGSFNRVSGTFFDLNANTYASAAIGIVPTCPTVTGATATCAALAGATNEKGTLRITVTAAGTAAGTVTMNFAGTFAGATGGLPSCNFNPAQTGTGAWNARASMLLSTRSTTAPVFSWDNNAAALGNLTWDVDYRCTAE